MPPALRVSLDGAALAELERRYHTARDAETRTRTRTRCQMVLVAARGHAAPRIATLTRRSADTVRRVLRRYLAGGVRRRAAPAPTRPAAPLPTRLGGRAGPGCRPGPTLGGGVDSALWSWRLLSDYLATVTGHAAGIETVRLALHRNGYVCKRPRWVLHRKAQEQAGWAKND
jgi:transposase